MMQGTKPGGKMVKFGEVVKNANLVERDPEADGVETIVGLEHIAPENPHIRHWNAVADGASFTRKCNVNKFGSRQRSRETPDALRLSGLRGQSWS